MSIEGLKLQISSSELKSLALGRLEYHNSKAKFFEAEVERLKPALAEMQSEAESMGKFTASSNPVKGLEDKFKTVLLILSSLLNISYLMRPTCFLMTIYVH